ncbi:MAG: transglutaminase N-terminal domain-containing protein [Prolixibacteraceae bacterium]
MIYTVRHTTLYEYDNFVSYCHNLATLKPREYSGQELMEYTLKISPDPTGLSERLDFFGNNITRFSIEGLHNKLEVTTHSKIKRDYGAIRASFFSDRCKMITLDEALSTLKSNTPQKLETQPFVLESPLIRKINDKIRAYAKVSFQANRSVFDAGLELMQRIFIDFKFDSGFTNVATPISEAFEAKKGVCQDFAQIAIACVRSVGLPARYMSGYIETLPPKGQKKLVGSDASHAWFAMYIPGFGWVDFDPTNNQIPADQHLVLAWGRDYYDVPPLKGVIYSNGKNKMKVAVDIIQQG